MKPIEILKERLTVLTYLESAQNILGWDQEVQMPMKGIQARATTQAHLSSIIHTKFLDIDHDGVLSGLKKKLDEKKLKGNDAIIVADAWREYERERKLPEPFVKELAELISTAQHQWQKAREKNSFKDFEPWLTKVIAMKRKETELVGYEKSPYDALIDTYEPGMTTDVASGILEDLKDFLVPYLAKIKASKEFKNKRFDRSRIVGRFPIEQQRLLNEQLAERLGFDLDAGKIEKSAHPFTISFHPHDVRFTTRYSETDVLESIGPTIHEAGHALYEQGLLPEHFGTAIGEAISLGIHESQSRMWENLIGNSREFWKYFYPKLQKQFPMPFSQIQNDEFYHIVNRVKPSLIRVQADEVTYNLHIILRFELEKALIEGTLKVKDLPQAWNAKMKQYFGINVPKDSVGVLQDVHWSVGLIGYFPTYSFGNLYASQFYAIMQKEIPDIKKKITKGEFGTIREWLRKNIHATGKTYSAAALVEKLTGEPLTSKYYKKYIEEKYNELYDLK